MAGIDGRFFEVGKRGLEEFRDMKARQIGYGILGRPDDYCFCPGMRYGLNLLRRRQLAIDRDHDRAGPRQGKYCDEILRRIHQGDRHNIASLDAGGLQVDGNREDVSVQVLIGDDPTAIDYGRMIWATARMLCKNVCEVHALILSNLTGVQARF